MKIFAEQNQTLHLNLSSIASDPNFVFENDPDFQTLRLFDVEGNVINVNSWVECANYVNGGWTNSLISFHDDIIFLLITVYNYLIFLIKKFLSGRNYENLCYRLLTIFYIIISSSSLVKFTEQDDDIKPIELTNEASWLLSIKTCKISFLNSSSKFKQ